MALPALSLLNPFSAVLAGWQLGESFGNKISSVFDSSAKVTTAAPDANPIEGGGNGGFLGNLKNIIDTSKTSDSGIHFEQGSNVTIYDSSLKTDGSASGNASSGKNLGESLAGTLSEIGTTGLFILAGGALVAFIVLRK